MLCQIKVLYNNTMLRDLDTMTIPTEEREGDTSLTFHPITIEAKDQIKTMTQGNRTSDYNFVSLLSWGEGQYQYSTLNDNLVVRFTDYISNKPVLSFLGTRNVPQTVTTLMDYARAHDYETRVCMVSRECIKPYLLSHDEDDTKTRAEQEPGEARAIKQLVGKIVNTDTNGNMRVYGIFEERDNDDYLLSPDKIVDMTSKNKGKGGYVKRFEREYPDARTERIDLTDPKVRTDIRELFYHWEEAHGKNKDETQNELDAIENVLKHADQLELEPIGIYDRDTLVAFSIDEVSGDDLVIHFEKARADYVGAYQVLKRETALLAKQLGCTAINYEQDLGLPSLWNGKRQWGVSGFVQKYYIEELSEQTMSDEDKALQITPQHLKVA
jgi:hypothetical protein